MSDLLGAVAETEVVQSLGSKLQAAVGHGASTPVFGTDGTVTIWQYLSPAEQIVEALFLTTIGMTLYLVLTLSEGAQKKKEKEKETKMMKKKSGAYTKTTLDYILAGVNVITLLAYIFYRFNDHTLFYFAQPCTIISCLTLSLHLRSGAQSEEANRFFSMIVAQLWGPIIATALPDEGAGWQPFELFNFYVLHLGIVLAPLYFMLSGRYSYIEGTSHWPLKSLAINILYHMLVLRPLSLFLAVNLDVQLFPHNPAFLVLSEALGLGPYYVSAATCVTLVLCQLTPLLYLAVLAITRKSFGVPIPAVKKD